MKNIVSESISSPAISNPGKITIVDEKNRVLSTFDNNLELVDENCVNLKPGNYLIIDNPHFDIVLSCRYINEWISKRNQVVSNKVLKKNSMMKKVNVATSN